MPKPFKDIQTRDELLERVDQTGKTPTLSLGNQYRKLKERGLIGSTKTDATPLEVEATVCSQASPIGIAVITIYI